MTLQDRINELEAELEWWKESAENALRCGDWEQLQESALVLLRIEGVQEMLHVLLLEKSDPQSAQGSSERMTLPPGAFSQGPENQWPVSPSPRPYSRR